MTDTALARRALALLDLTELGDAATSADIEHLCRKARGGGGVPRVAAVCVWPHHAAEARMALAGSGIRVASVINFPFGVHPIRLVIDEAQQVIGAGAGEIDLVMPWQGFLAGDKSRTTDMIRAVRSAMPADLRLKVILESGSYPDAASIRAAADLAIEAGADFIKTSTGKNGTGATLEAARVMLEAIRASGRNVGFKPSGGIRTATDAGAYLALADEIMGPGWATPETFRFGASGLHDALTGVLPGAGGGQKEGY